MSNPSCYVIIYVQYQTSMVEFIQLPFAYVLWFPSTRILVQVLASHLCLGCGAFALFPATCQI
jgi:hypothetical protein